MPLEDQARKLRTAKSSVATATPATAASTCVVWVSLDPRKGTIDFYPHTLCEALETAWARGETELDIGRFIKGAVVRLRPRTQQRTERGSRDVRRVELMGPEAGPLE